MGEINFTKNIFWELPEIFRTFETVFENGLSKICGRQPLKKLKGDLHPFKNFKGCFPQVLLGLFLNTLPLFYFRALLEIIFVYFWKRLAFHKKAKLSIKNHISVYCFYLCHQTWLANCLLPSNLTILFAFGRTRDYHKFLLNFWSYDH